MAKIEQTGPTIPEFASYEEEAAFWDSHSLVDFIDEFEEVESRVVQPIGHVLGVRIESEAFRRLAALARARETNMVTLAQSWVLEALDRELAAATGAGNAGGQG